MSKKSEIITFKADQSLLKAFKGVENRSRFIRQAVSAALENVCPLCKGSGTLTVNQMRHWDTFAEDHSLRRCSSCHEVHLVCGKRPSKQPHQRKPARN